MDLSTQILSDITIYMKYAKYLPKENRRETWDEIVDRNMSMHVKKFPKLKEEIESAFQLVRERKILPSMRALQFGGKPIEISPNRGFNCSFTPIDNWEVFGEIMFLLLGGTGVGYSVQVHHVNQLPEVKQHIKKTKRYLINDSIEGWADAVKILVKSYFFGLAKPNFDFSDIREKGTPLKTSGGKAPGPQPLKDCIHNIEKIFSKKEPGTKLTPLECHDLICHIADAVLAGGIRRAALIAFFSVKDEEMLSCKYGDWSELNPQRGRANNSVVILRHKITEKKFAELWERIKASGSGEPGVCFTNNAEWLGNPCLEISLRANQFCNLCTINVSNVKSQDDLNLRVRSAALIGTLQASYTNFHYIRDIWQKTTEKEALLGISMTGIASGTLDSLDLSEAAKLAVEENKRVANLVGINPAARVTCVKPEGTASCVVGSSSGIHPWKARYYIRRLRVLKNEAIYKYLKRALPQLIEDDYFKPLTQAIISIPIKAPDGAITQLEESAIQLLERIKKYHTEWIKPGHIDGENTHNVSATVHVKDHEWDEVGKWMWDNRNYYNGLTVLPYDGGTYKQAPFEDITEEQYKEMYELLRKIDLKKVLEEEDNTNLIDQAACAGGVCEIM